MSLLTRHIKFGVIEQRLLFLKSATMHFLQSNGVEVRMPAIALARVASASSRNVPVTASITLEERIHESRTLLLNAATAITVTLPPATGSGSIFKFKVAQVNTAGYSIKVPVGTNLFRGTILETNSTSAGALRGWTAGATDDTITLNGTTTGGVSIGDWIEIQDIAPLTWSVTGSVTGSGVVATPFSDTVA